MKLSEKIESYFGVILLLLVSDSICFLYKFSPFPTFLSFFLFSFYRAFRKKTLFSKNDSSIYVLIFGISILLNIYYFNTHTLGNNGLAIFVCLLASYFFYSSYDLDDFKRIYLAVIKWIVITGVPVYLLAEMNMLPTYLLPSFEGGLHSMFLIFHIGWPSYFHRFSGIWHEPGACTIFLNFAILLYSKELQEGNIDKKLVRSIIIITIGILFTQSTTGYMAFATIIAYSIFPLIKRMSIGRKLFAGLVFILAIFLIVNSPVVTEKLSQEKTDKTSLGVREMDNMAMLTMALDRPFTGYGYQTKEFDSISYYLDNKTSSNGILYIAACSGIWWILLFVIYSYRGISRMHFKMPIFVLIIFIILECNERFVELPISYLFILNFKERWE